MGLWTRKAIESVDSGDGPKLRRSLGPLNLVALGLVIYGAMHAWRGRTRVAA